MLDKIGPVKYNAVDWERAYKFWTETVGIPFVWADAHAGWGEFGPVERCHIRINRRTTSELIPHTEAAPVANFNVGDASK